MSDNKTSLVETLPLNGLHKTWPILEIKEMVGGEICSLTALKGGVPTLRKKFQNKYGAPLPAQGKVVSFNGGFLFSSAPEQWFVHFNTENAFLDVELGAVLKASAAVTLQTDAWVRLAIIGASAPQVLERLVTLDLSDQAFPAGMNMGSAARTMLGHLNVFIIRPDNASDSASGGASDSAPNIYEIWCARSFANSLAHEICVAAENIYG